MLLLLTFGAFAASFLLIWSLLWLLVENPLARRNVVSRLEALQQTEFRNAELPEVLHKDLMSGVPAFHRLLSRTPGTGRLQLFLSQAAVRMTVGRFLLTVAGCAALALASGLALAPPLAALLLAAAGGSVPFVVTALLRRRRFNRFEELLPEAMDLLGRAVRAGHAFTTGFELIGAELADPVAEEFRITFQQQNLGLPLRDALENLTVRVPLPDVRIFVSALQIQRESGGNLAGVLDSMAYVIRERFKLRRQIRTYTAEGRLSSYMLTAIPFVALVALCVLKPGYIDPLFEDPRGQAALLGAGILQILGYLVIRRIVNLKV
jgi:tight adherence protein B